MITSLASCLVDFAISPKYVTLFTGISNHSQRERIGIDQAESGRGSSAYPERNPTSFLAIKAQSVIDAFLFMIYQLCQIKESHTDFLQTNLFLRFGE